MNTTSTFASGHRDQLVGDVENADGLTHVEHERLAVPSDCCRLNDKLHRLGNRHEVPGDLGVRDGHRSTVGDLLAKAVSTDPRLPSTLPKRTDT